jgi:hypothetical protein
MGRFCYCSKIISGKTTLVREHWQKKHVSKDPDIQTAEVNFWHHLKMTGFESWLQESPQGDFMIHCLEGESLQQILKGLREQIAVGNSIALKLQDFYQKALGKDYSSPQVVPQIENLLDISLPTTPSFIKRAFFYPLLHEKEEAHQHFSKEARGEKRMRHESMMRAFGVSRLSTWLQSTSDGKYIVVYTEGHKESYSSSEERLKQGEGSIAWQEIANILRDHTDLGLDELSPDVEWLTKPKMPIQANRSECLTKI